MDKDSLGRCLIENHLSFEETMKLKMQDDNKQPDRVAKEIVMEKTEKLEKRVKYAKNVSNKIQSDLHENYIDPDALVLIDDVMTPRGNLLPGFIPFGSVPEYEPRKTMPKMPPVPGQPLVQPVVPKTPFADMIDTVEAAKKRAEEMAAGEKQELVATEKKSVKKATKKKANKRSK